MKEGFSKGEVSEWHEGNFKTLRLHDAQVMINKCKLQPFSRIFNPPFIKWGYEILADSITILLGEGMSKYTSKEYDTCKSLRKEVEEIIEGKQICRLVRKEKVNRLSLDKENWKKLKEKLEEYEYLVKLYNDKHGLSTRNVGTGDLF